MGGPVVCCVEDCGRRAAVLPVIVLRWRDPDGSPRENPSPATLNEFPLCDGCADDVELEELLTGCLKLEIHGELARQGRRAPDWGRSELLFS